MVDEALIALHRVSEDYEAGRKDGIDEERAAVVRYLDAMAHRMADTPIAALTLILIKQFIESGKHVRIEAILAPHLRTADEERVLEAARALVVADDTARMHDNADGLAFTADADFDDAVDAVRAASRALVKR
jgi:hypothetical protein